MKYKAYFAFQDKDQIGGGSLIRYFEVDGGASRTINLDKPEDMDIGSEMEQARTYKNIVVYLPPTKGIEIALLSKHFVEKTGLKIALQISVSVGSTLIKRLELYENLTGKITSIPSPDSEKTLVKVTASIPNVKLTLTSHRSKNVIVRREW